MPISLIVHGGAWDIPDDEVAEHQAGCRAALDAGWQVLQRGGAALDAVEAAVRVLEQAGMHVHEIHIPSLHAADEALLRAKRQGRGTVCG